MNKYALKHPLIKLSILFTVIFSELTHAHQGAKTTEPRIVCAEKKLGDSCEWKNAHNALYIGTCRKVSTSLLCVRNKPIIYPKDMSHENLHKKSSQ